MNSTGVTFVVEVDEPCVLTIAGWGSHDLSTGANVIALDLAADALNVLNLSVVDLAGNAAAPVSFSVITDLTPPSLEVLEPTPGEVLRQPIVQLKGMTDPDATLTIDGKPCPATVEGLFSAELELEEGTNHIVLTVGDDAGNVATLTVDLTYEPEGPGSDVDDGSGGYLAIIVGVLVSLAAASVIVWRVRRRGI